MGTIAAMRPSPTYLLALALLAFLFGSAAPAAPAGEDAALQTYRKRFVRETYPSDREDLLAALTDLGTEPARNALAWCVQKSRDNIDAAVRDADKSAKKLAPLQADLDEQYDKYAAQEAKRGNPNPTTVPHWPIIDKVNAARADLDECEKNVTAERGLRETAVDSHGRCVDKLSAADQTAYAAALAKGPLQAKDWTVRAEQYELLRAAHAPWVRDVLVAAAVGDPDPRALAVALEALGGRDAAVVVPVLAARLDEVRWIVRAAALSALEHTPSRETVDAVLALFAKEEGRLRDDCLRILEALTGADVARTPEAWKQWWAENRTAWNAPPKARSGPPTEAELAAKAQKKAASTGFFGIETSSKRLCFVIDVSGSMNEKATEKGKETRAEMAKTELVRAIRALEDGSYFAIVMFANDITPWKTEMTVASDETRKSAVAFVEGSPVVGATNTYGALETAFQTGEPAKSKPSDAYADPLLDTIILLSDGKPTRGRTTKTAEIRAAVREWNLRRRVTVHTIAFGKDADFEFLEGLATDTGGSFSSQ